jgi:hypothetical protein
VQNQWSGKRLAAVGVDLDRARVKQLAKDGLGPAKIARELGMARRSVYRLLEE